ncbi:DUF222 domain-containing protein [Kocuria sp. M1R5S2]|uniref:HNH endonuclease signature motif containing protein n=1 Tax=Kocuria rhizosphaerae TaxID=3376285 RepID=UPI0037A86BDC
MTTTAQGPRDPEERLLGELPPEDAVLAAIYRNYGCSVEELLGDARAEASAAGRQFRVIHRMWVLQGQANQRHRVVLARWLARRPRRAGRLAADPPYRPLLEVAEEIGPALHLPSVTAVRRVETAILLAESLPQVLEALERGEIGVRQAEVIAQAWRDLAGSALHPAPEPRPPVEAARRLAAELLERAPEVTAAQLRALYLRRRASLVRGTEEARHRAARAARRVWVEADQDGMARLCALLDAATAHAALHRLETIAGRVNPDDIPALTGDDRNDDQDPCNDEHSGNGPDGGPDGGPDAGQGAGEARPRTRAQLCADVLADLVLEGEPEGMPEHLRGIRGQVTVTVPALTLLQRSGAEPGDAAPGDAELSNHEPPAAAAPDGNPVPGTGLSGDVASGGVAVRWPGALACAELEGYGPIPDSLAARIAAAAPSWTRVLTHPLTGVVLAHDRTTYAVPADLKRRLRARDGTCRFPGCRRAAARCDLDHTVAWAEGGTTEAGNLAHLCRAHHRLKHRQGPLGRWRVEQPEQEGVLVWTSPAGRVHVSYPAHYHHPVLSSVRIPAGPLSPDDTAQEPGTAQEPRAAQELRQASELARFWGPAWAWNRARARGLLPDDPPPF